MGFWTNIGTFEFFRLNYQPPSRYALLFKSMGRVSDTEGVAKMWNHNSKTISELCQFVSMCGFLWMRGQGGALGEKKRNLIFSTILHFKTLYDDGEKIEILGFGYAPVSWNFIWGESFGGHKAHRWTTPTKLKPSRGFIVGNIW